MDRNSQRKNYTLVIILAVLLVVVGGVIVYFVKFRNNDTPNDEIETKDNNKYLAYRLAGNSLEDFDLYFLQLENEKKNKLYSPLSIKYALGMLEEGAEGETKDQISNIIGTYSPKKYANSANMSFANALFIRDSFKDSILSSYVDILTNKYSAEVMFDSFNTPDALNDWVSNNTFKLINNLIDKDGFDRTDFVLVNALAIDMEWVNIFQLANYQDWGVSFKYENFASEGMAGLKSPTDSHKLDFNGTSVKSLKVDAVANKYDIVNVLGEDNIRQNISTKYEEFINSDFYRENCMDGNTTDTTTFVDNYIKILNQQYKQFFRSTDFYYYNDDNVKVFAKDLKEYDGTTLQYVGIMPRNVSLDEYIKNIKSSDVNALINNLKPVEYDSFKEGIITEVYGSIPLFKFDYELKLINDFSKLGITNVFDEKKADLSKLSSYKPNVYIMDARHKANIEFSNNGIKAAAATSLSGGKGAGGSCVFDYQYDVPVEKIDLTFDNPYMFIIRDKNTGEVWFTGTVYEPELYSE